jgi:hypothetical protein
MENFTCSNSDSPPLDHASSSSNNLNTRSERQQRNKRHIQREANDVSEDDSDNDNFNSNPTEQKSNLTCKNVQSYNRSVAANSGYINARNRLGNYLNGSDVDDGGSRAYYSKSKRPMYDSDAANVVAKTSLSLSENFISQNGEEVEEPNDRGSVKVENEFEDDDESDNAAEDDSLNTITLSSSNSIVELSSQDNVEFYGEHGKWSRLSSKKENKNNSAVTKNENTNLNDLADNEYNNGNGRRRRFINLTEENENDGEEEDEDEEEISFPNDTRRLNLKNLHGNILVTKVNQENRFYRYSRIYYLSAIVRETHPKKSTHVYFLKAHIKIKFLYNSKNIWISRL